MQARIKNGRRYMGVVTDKEWKFALLEQYPCRKPNHPDSNKRRDMAVALQDVPELSLESNKHEARRYYVN